MIEIDKTPAKQKKKSTSRQASVNMQAQTMVKMHKDPTMTKITHAQLSTMLTQDDTQNSSFIEFAKPIQVDLLTTQFNSTNPHHLPQINSKLTQNSKFQNMVYDRTFVLNIDNPVTNRNNVNYISGYYKQLSDSSIIPAQQSLTQKSLRTLDFKSPIRKNSLSIYDRTVNKTQVQKPRLLNEQSRFSDIKQDSQLLPEASQTIEQKLPLIDTLNKGIQQSSLLRATQLISATEKKKHKKTITKQLIGMADNDSHADSDTPFKNVGTLEKPIDQQSNSNRTESYINSSVFNVLEDNYQDYMQELEDQKAALYRQSQRVRSKLIPAERLKFDADQEFARITMLNYKANKEEGDEVNSEEEVVETERDFDKLRARIKLRSIKKFDEDKLRQKQLVAKAAAAAANGDERLTSAQKKRKKHEPIKRRRSFAEVQLKYDDGLELYSAEKAANKTHSLTDRNTIQKMQQAKRFPIPEGLLNQPKNYWLKIDSIIHHIYNIESLILTSKIFPDLRAPKNSDVSEDNLSIGEISEEEDEQVIAEQKKSVEVSLVKQVSALKQFDKSLVIFQPYNIANLTIFPHKARDGEVQLNLLKTPKLEYLSQILNALTEQQKKVQFQYSHQTIQSIFEHYCELFKVASFDLVQYLCPSENNRTKLSFKNTVISEDISKALACTIPFIHGVYEAEFVSNQITDMMSSLILISCFVNPSIKRLSYVNNFARNTFKKTFGEFVKENPAKWTEVNLQASMLQIEIMEGMTKNFSQRLIKLNISGNGISMNGCRVLNLWLLKQQYIKDLNMSRCKLANQGARYIIDAINRNVSIRHLNISCNDFQSSIYEFSIKIASTLTRHPSLLHCDLSQVSFKREEVMFIILAMSVSKNFLSLHITGNDLPYYERIFMRSLIAARVGFAFKDTSRLEVQRNKERYQVMQIASKEHLHPELKKYLDTFDSLEQQRQGLDFEIQDLIQEIDMEKQYSKVQHITKLSELNPDSKLKLLIDKMTQRQLELQKQQESVHEMIKMTGPEIKDKLDQISKVDSMLNPSLKIDSQAEQQLKDRQRQRAELEVIKNKKDRSAGEMALLFMGINQAAFDLLIENPMTGYMNDIIYSRILGHDDIEQGQYWLDTTQCYICQKWDKQVISYDPRVDGSKWSQRITQIDHLKQTIETVQTQAQEAELVKAAQLKEEIEAQARFERQRKIALGEESDDNEQQTSVQQDKKVQKKEKIGNLRNLKVKLNLKPSDRGLNQTLNSLKSVGKEILSPRFGGLNGLTPKVQQDRKQSSYYGDEQMAKRSRVNSTVDNGALSHALDQTPIGEELVLDRTDTPNDRVTRPNKLQFNSENPLTGRALQINQVQSHIFPEQFMNANDFIDMNLHSEPSTPEEGQYHQVSHGAHDKYMYAKQLTRYGGPPGGLPGKNKKLPPQKIESLKDLSKNAMKINENLQRVNSPHQSVTHSIVTSIQNVGSKRQRGQPQKIQRTLFFAGMVYVIEEEVYSDSDNSSVYTSEDDFEEDKGMVRNYIARIDDYNARQQHLEEERRRQLLNPVKTEKEKRLEKLGIIDEQKQELSQAQKEYKTKIWPKYYIPELKQQKAQQLDQLGLELNIHVGGIKEGKRFKIDRGPELKSGPLKNPVAISIVASWNDWMPIKLKTQRELVFEKVNPDEPIPKATFVLDNQILIHANYIPPGRHYFYFVNNEGLITLSPSYQIVRFKTTQIFLNQLVVKPRMFDFDSVQVVKGGDEEAEVFMKDRSVFRDFKDDNKSYLRKCFEQDINYTKIQRTVKGEEDVLEDIKEVLFKHFVKINNIFLYYIGISTYPTISMNDFTSWANKCNIIDGKWINLSTLDRILITTNVALHGLISSAERDLNRYEFLEIIVRIANALYRESKVCETTPQAIIKLLQENIFPNSKEVDGETFRRFQCYNVKVNEILKKNESVLKKVYNSYTHNKKKFITLPECREYIKKVGLDVSEMQVGVIFAESMQTLVDTIIDQDRPNQMKFVEFLVFLCRITYEHYRGTHYENELMYLKLEKTIPMYLNVIGVNPLFLFYEDFEYKPPARKAKKVKVVKNNDSEDDESKKSDEEEEEEDSSSEDDLGEQVTLEEGKYKLAANFIAKMQREKEEKAERRRVRQELKEKKAQEIEAQAKQAQMLGAD